MTSEDIRSYPLDARIGSKFSYNVVQICFRHRATFSRLISIQDIISPAAINALKDALTHIYWTKGDPRRFVFNSLSSNTNSIVSTIDWDNQTKYESASQLIDRMSARSDIYRDDLFALFEQAVNFNDFSHLKRWEDADLKIQRAKDAVEALRKQAKGYFNVVEEKRKLRNVKK